MKREPRVNKGTVDRWIDGDTVVVMIEKLVDLDFDFKGTIFYPVRIRIEGFDAPETKGLSKLLGDAALAFAERMAPPGTTVAVTSRMVKSRERFVAKLTLPDGADFATMMKDAGHHTGKYEK